MLKDTPLHMNTLAKLTGNYHAMMLFTFFVAWLMGIGEHVKAPEIPAGDNSASRKRLRPVNLTDFPLLLRILTPVLKASVCKRSIHALQECMEALSGVGYLDNSENEAINIASLYRDCCVDSIWEGTTDVLAGDTVRILKGRNSEEVLGATDRWITKSLNEGTALESVLGNAKRMISQAWRILRDELQSNNVEDLLPSGRDHLFKIADIVM